MKVYELMAKLEKLPSGARVMCSGVKTIDRLTDDEPVGEDYYGNKEYPMTEDIIDVDVEGKRVFLQF